MELTRTDNVKLHCFHLLSDILSKIICCSSPITEGGQIHLSPWQSFRPRPFTSGRCPQIIAMLRICWSGEFQWGACPCLPLTLPIYPGLGPASGSAGLHWPKARLVLWKKYRAVDLNVQSVADYFVHRIISSFLKIKCKSYCIQLKCLSNWRHQCTKYMNL